MPQTAPRLLTKQQQQRSVICTVCASVPVCVCECVFVCVQLKSVLTSIVDLHSDNVHNLRAIIRTAIEQIHPIFSRSKTFQIPFKIKCKIYF